MRKRKAIGKWQVAVCQRIAGFVSALACIPIKRTANSVKPKADEPFSGSVVWLQNPTMREKRHRSAAGPLMCWDIFMESHHRRMQQAEGLTGLRQFASLHHWRVEWDLPQLLLAQEQIVLVTDTAQIIRFATPSMETMNGYTVEEVVGQSPKIFQGKDTDPNTRSQIREAIVRRLPYKGTILNYRKNGTPYNCLVEEYPVWNTAGTLVNFIAFEKIA